MRRRAQLTDPLIGSELDVVIDRLGARGDGIGTTEHGPVYVARTAPGETVRARLTQVRGDGYAATPLDILKPGPNRREAECPHFAACGACAAQHLRSATYATWKHGLIADALRRRALPLDILQPLATCPTADRRRAQLHASHPRAGVQLGFHARSSHHVADIAACTVMRPALVAVLPALRDALQVVLPRGSGIDVLLTETRSGIDLLLTGKPQLTPAALERLVHFARATGTARICWRPAAGIAPEPLLQFDQATIDIADIGVQIPPGAFLQASAAAENKLAEFVTSNLAEAKRAADLFAGLGAFTLPLARQGVHVHAVDTDQASLTAMGRAAGNSGLGGRITTEPRDLHATPLQPMELVHYDAVVFDPPRAGARRQAEVLAKAGPSTVIAISCEPGTFARDAAILVEGGYRLETVLPVDQFVYSSKLEVAALFRR